MTTRLANSSSLEQRGVIRFLLAESVKSWEILSRMQRQYGPSCMFRANFYKWVQAFEDGRESITDDLRSGRPVDVSKSFKKSLRKVMLTVFWDRNGPITISFLERGNTVNSENYCELLTQVKKDIKNKRRGLQSRGVILLQDNTRPHTAARTLAKIKDLGWKLLTHPPYSPDLAPSDFQLFGPLKESMKGIHFQTDEEVKAAVSNWLRTQSTEFYAKGIDNLISRWNKCVAKEGDYVEK